MIDTIAEQARFNGRIFCYVAIHSPINRDDRFAIGIAVLGEPGYSFPLALELFPTYNEASIRAEELNGVFPYSADACVAIVADTMIRQRQRRPTIDRLANLLLEATKDGTLDRLAGDVTHPETINDFCDAVQMLR
nr:hypothetical protein [Mesorhizobium sp.]